MQKYAKTKYRINVGILTRLLKVFLNKGIFTNLHAFRQLNNFLFHFIHDRSFQKTKMQKTRISELIVFYCMYFLHSFRVFLFTLEISLNYTDLLIFNSLFIFTVTKGAKLFYCWKTEMRFKQLIGKYIWGLEIYRIKYLFSFKAKIFH